MTPLFTEADLVVCPGCRRHVCASSARCPFCACIRAQFLHVAAAVLVAGCAPPQQETVVPMGAPPEPAVSVQALPPPATASAQPLAAAPAPSASGPVYEPPAMDAAPDGGVVEAYGPPPRAQAPVYGPP